MTIKRQCVLTIEMVTENTSNGHCLDGTLFVGKGSDVVLAISEATGLSTLAILDFIVHRLLVHKGADWTGVILSEYLGLYNDSAGLFALVWDETTQQLVSHGCTFRSTKHPWAAILAHIRTLDDFKGLGLGTRVTEAVTSAAFDCGAKLVVLETDDKLHRLAQGGQAAHAMYSRIGYAILGEKRLADTVDWMMAINKDIFVQCQEAKLKLDGKFPKEPAEEILQAQEEFVDGVRQDFSQAASIADAFAVEPISPGDLANVFVLLNLCPLDDFRLKLSSWGVQHGPEAERNFIATLRQAIVDQDRLQDATMVARNSSGAIVAICAAQQLAPFTRQTFTIDFYCLPQFLVASHEVVFGLVKQTIKRIEFANERPHPCRLTFTGIDERKCSLFTSLDFTCNLNPTSFYGPTGQVDFSANEYVLVLE